MDALASLAHQLMQLNHYFSFSFLHARVRVKLLEEPSHSLIDILNDCFLDSLEYYVELSYFIYYGA